MDDSNHGGGNIGRTLAPHALIGTRISGGAGGAPQPNAPTATYILEQIGERVNALHEKAAELHAITDRLVGTRPEPAPSNAATVNRPNPPHVNGKMSLICDELGELCERLNDSLARLERFV